ncbi:MAG: GNAT family N-acetyltransferase [Deltaproteobacteria bacterium]|nr:GNAT family N-acetyltransferase [Deltaproteobacteria bacterium]
MTPTEPFEIHRITDQDLVSRWRPGFIGAYQTIFAAEPYRERFYPSEADSTWRKLTGTPGHITLVATQDDRLIGFAIAVPLHTQRSVMRVLGGLVPPHHTLYMAELGVLEAWRERGVATALIRRRFELMDQDRYSHVVTRVPATKSIAYDRYRRQGLEDMGVYMDVTSRRVDGSISSDRRLLLHGVLSQLHFG